MPVYDNRPSLRGDRGAHFIFEAGGRTIVYCYIRKNACTAFKRLICDESPHREQIGESRDEFQFMRRFHRVISHDDFDRADHVLFIYRDPMERAASLFRDKFIRRSGHEHIFESFETRTGSSPEEATFTRFAEDYLGGEGGVLDPHCTPQADHLFPIRYSDAIAMRDLGAAMPGIIGDELGAKYFGRPINAAPKNEYHDPCGDTPSARLHLRFQETGQVPSIAALAGERAVAAIRSFYAGDYQLVEQLGIA
ncbi:MAG: sulfotransferase family protein [Deltaproteobacteria bacterium]|nr:sulfotransferase family protein [Deltaproteobacteria bacterium]